MGRRALGPPCITRVLVVSLAALLVGVACSAGSGNRGEKQDKDVIAGSSRQRSSHPEPKQIEPDGGIGDGVSAGDLSFRVFEVRTKDRIYAIAEPGAEPKSRGNISSEYVAIDYLVKNVSGSPLTTGAEAKLIDDQGNPHKQDPSIEPPGGGTDGMGLGTGQTRASSMFFEVPNGTVPETLVITARRGKVRIDLLIQNQDEIPPDDYLRVYHLYLGERAHEEAYEMFDPAYLHGITLGEWLSFWEPLWGKQYITLDSLRPLYEGSHRATFRMERTFYDRDGDIAADPEISPVVTQEMTKTDGEWRLVMDESLATDIIAVVGPEETPAPDTTVPESTQPPTTVPETTGPESTTAAPTVRDYDCTDFDSQEEAQLYLTPGDHYGLDPDDNGLACENLP